MSPKTALICRRRSCVRPKHNSRSPSVKLTTSSSQPPHHRTCFWTCFCPVRRYTLLRHLPSCSHLHTFSSPLVAVVRRSKCLRADDGNPEAETGWRCPEVRFGDS